MLLRNVSCSSQYKGILNKIVNGDPKLLFHIFKVKYLKIKDYVLKYYYFHQADFPEKKFLENIHKTSEF